MTQIDQITPNSPLSEARINKLMRHSDLSLESLGIGRSCARRHTLTLIDQLTRASLQHALYAPSNSLSWRFELSPDRSSVISAEFFEREWVTNKAVVLGSSMLSAPLVCDKIGQIFFRNIALFRDPIERRYTLTLEQFDRSINIIRRDEFEVDLESAEVLTFSRELSDVVDWQSDRAGRIVAIENSIACQDFTPLNRSLNRRIKSVVESLSARGDYYQGQK